MGKTMLIARQCLYFGLFLNIPAVASQTTVEGSVDDRVLIPCLVGGTYTLPQWRKAGRTITTQGVTGVNPLFPRISFDTDQKTLVVSPAQVEDSGTYECTHTAGTNSPQNTIVVITEAIILVSCFGKGIAVCVFFVLTIVDYIVVIIKGIYMLNNDDNRKRRQLPCCHYVGLIWQTQVRVILIIAIVIFIAVSGWFIGMMVTVDAFQEMTQSNCNVYIGLLSFEVFDFVLGVCLIICLLYIDYLTKINPKPGDTEQHFPLDESVSRKNVNLNPTTPNYKNIFTTEFRSHSPGSEQSNK